MAARAASVTGLWSDTATWGGAAVPVSGDTVTINAGVDVTFDVDQSGFAAGLGASVNNGRIIAKRSAGTYILKLNGNLTGTGLIDASDGSGGAYASGQTFQITFNTTSVSNSLSGVQNIICLEPSHKYVKLTQAANAGDTVLNIDTDLTGESTYWVNGNLVNIDNVNQAAQSEQKTISSRTLTTLTLTAGLTNAKSVGSYLILASRNVKLIGAGTAGGTAFSAPGTGSVIGCEIRNLQNALTASLSVTLNGVITNCANGIASTAQGFILNAPMSGCTTAIAAALGGLCASLISGCGAGLSVNSNMIVTGILSGNGSAIVTSAGITLDGAVVSGNTTGVSNSSGLRLLNASFSSNSRDLSSCGSGQCFTTLFGSALQFNNYNAASRNAADYVESFDNGQVSGAYRNWCRGGITSSNTGTVYGNRARSYQHALELGVAGSYSFRDQQILVPAGGWVNVNCFIQKDASMSYLPTLQIFPASVEPLIAGSPSATVSMTNSTNTWEVLFAKYQNTSTAPQLVKVRVIGQNASGNLYEDTDISVSPFGFALGVAA